MILKNRTLHDDKLGRILFFLWDMNLSSCKEQLLEKNMQFVFTAVVHMYIVLCLFYDSLTLPTCARGSIILSFSCA